ncbi:DUF4336 domain-containing protein [Ideonella livida]|uniref:DUF4336 domain-containing protein n=1 Tax=Ideonella livida TaxID=2707176 RepID=A0A7C9TIE0_9BURK|nr:DUF4336 domain-containing protein [Ideonella livida]NDY91259.1 DUF4336 domain-containing protein [Ideonella livida]
MKLPTPPPVAWSPQWEYTLSPVTADIWIVRHPLMVRGVEITTCMTVVRLPEGRLWLHSPVPMDVTLRSQLAGLGRVSHVVAPNRHHHRFVRQALAHWPQATLHAAPGLGLDHPDLAAAPLLGAASSLHWGAELSAWPIEGQPGVAETVFFHHPSRTLIVTDLLTWFGPWDAWPVRAWARLQGCLGEPAVPQRLRRHYTQRAAAARSIAQVLALQPRRIVLGHGPVVQAQATERLVRAFAWLPGLDP